MEEWKEYKLGDISSMKYGKLPPNLVGGIYPVWSGYRYVGTANTMNCPKGTMVVVARGVGGTGDVKVAKEDCYLTNLSIAVFLDERICNPYYLHYKYLLNNLKYLDSGSAQSQITIDDLKRLTIKLPPLYYQNQIVAALKSFDDKIECNQLINDNLQQQAKALYKSWFVDFDPFKDGQFEDSELGLIPHGWSVKQLGEITTQVNERVKERADVKVLSPITTGELVLSEEYFTKQVFSESISKYIVVKPSDFAYNPARVNIGSLGMNEYEFDGCVSPVYVVIRCEDGYQYFFDLFRRTESFKEEVRTRAIGGVRQSLAYKDFSLIKVVYPPIDVIHSFNQVYSRILAKTKHNDVETARLASLRDTLLPRLMSGKLKISEINL